MPLAPFLGLGSISVNLGPVFHLPRDAVRDHEQDDEPDCWNPLDHDAS